MYPLFYYWFKGKNIRLFMDFKTEIHKLSDNELKKLYSSLDCRATDRVTDLSESSLAYLLDNICGEAKSLVDVGCGNGHFLRKMSCKTVMGLFACDFYSGSRLRKDGIPYVQSNIERLPFHNKSIDVVACFHTLEHVRNIAIAVSEIKRIARKQILIVVPKQRYYNYSLDLHLHFFPRREDLTRLIGLESFSCRNIDGDWVYIGDMPKSFQETG